MINQQLVDFIKSELLKGADRETIKKQLLGSGWNIEDIEEGFGLATAKNINLTGNSSTPIPPTIDVETYNKGKKITILFSFITVIIAANLIFGDELRIIKDDLVKSIKGSKTEIINQIKQVENVNTEIQQEGPATPQQNQNQNDKEIEPVQESSPVTKIEDKKVTVVSTEKLPSSVKTGPINCGKDMSCFINNSKTCTPAFVEETTTLDLFGMYSQTNKTKMTLTGYDSSKKCGYLSEVISANVDYSSEIKSSPEYMAATEAEKKEDLAKPNESVKSTIGMVTKCSFTTAYLTDLLNKWQKGSYSSDDYKPGNCTTTDSAGKVYPMM